MGACTPRIRQRRPTTHPPPRPSGALELNLGALPLLSAVAGFSAPRSIDTQYNELFRGYNTTVDSRVSACVDIPRAADIADGSFIMPSLGQFNMGPMSLNGALDAYGKLSRFTISGGRVCFAARMMATGFWNASVAEGEVAPGVLFMETTPPRGNKGMTNLKGPNDNSYVNTVAVGDRFFAVTDSRFVVEFDPTSLAVLSDVKFDDHLDRMTVGLGSAPVSYTHLTLPTILLV